MALSVFHFNENLFYFSWLFLCNSVIVTTKVYRNTGVNPAITLY